jgi:O-antigen/teichoic acid export membrane protein
MDKSDTINRIISGFAWEGSTKLLVQMVTWVTTILVARILSPEDYGIVAISGLFTGVLAIITDMGFMSALINQDEVSREEQDTAFWFNIFISLFLFLLIYFTAPLIAAAYGQEILADIIRTAAFILPLTSLKIVPTAIAMRALNYRYRAITEMAGQFTTAMASIVLAYSGFGVWTLVYSVLIGQTVVVVAYLPLLRHFPVFSADFRKIRNIVTYGSHLMMSQILEFFTLKADVFIISIFLPHKVLGFYSMGLQLATMPLDKIGSVFNRVGFPAISRVKHNRDESRKIFVYMHRYLVAITYPILVGFTIIAHDLVALVLTEKWLPVVPIIQVLCVINLMRVSGMIMPYVLAGLGHSRGVLKYQVLSSILLPLTFLVGVQYGINGVLAGWFVVFPVLYVIIISMLSRHLHMPARMFLSTFKSSVVSATIMFAGVYVVNTALPANGHLLRIVIDILSGAAIYFIAFGVLFNKDLVSIIDALKRIRSRRNAMA